MTPKVVKILSVVADVESVFSVVRAGQKRMDIGGLNVSIRRMECFAVHGTKCVSCNQQGNIILVEEWPNGQIHVDLYSKAPNNSKVLMTIDHILPKSRGGGNNINNYQPMCQPCNSKKGNKVGINDTDLLNAVLPGNKNKLAIVVLGDKQNFTSIISSRAALTQHINQTNESRSTSC